MRTKDPVDHYLLSVEITDTANSSGSAAVSKKSLEKLAAVAKRLRKLADEFKLGVQFDVVDWPSGTTVRGAGGQNDRYKLSLRGSGLDWKSLKRNRKEVARLTKKYSW